MERICIDYDAALGFLKGDPNMVEKLRHYADKEEICMTPFTMIHLLESVRRKEVLSAFLSNLKILPFDRRAAFIYNKLLLEQGKPAEEDVLDYNMMTAAICLANDAFLLTKSTKRFDGIKGLKKV